MSTDTKEGKVNASKKAKTKSKDSKVDNESQEPDNDEDVFKKSLWAWDAFDFDKTANLIWLVVFRLIEAVATTYNLQHPDQYWQGT